MAGGSYFIEQANSPAKKDTSFRSCVCALLVVLCICLIGLLVTGFIKASSNKEKPVFIKFKHIELKVSQITFQGENDYFGSESINQDSTTKFTTQTTKRLKITTTTKTVIEPFITKSTTKFIDSVTTPIVENTDTTTAHTLSEQGKTQTYRDETTISTQGTETFNNSANRSDGITVATTHLSTKTETNTETTRFTTNAQKPFTQTTSKTAQTTTFEDPQNTTITTESSPSDNTEIHTKISVKETTITTQAPLVSVKTNPITDLQNVSKTTVGKITTNGIFQTSTTKLQTTQTATDRSFPLNLRNAVFSNANDVCETASCKLAAVDILMPMNHSVDPCDDFYEFACGRFAKTRSDKSNEFLLHVNRISSASPDYLKTVKIFFDSCLLHENEFLSSKTIQQGNLCIVTLKQVLKCLLNFQQGNQWIILGSLTLTTPKTSQFRILVNYQQSWF